jgi:diguanylate cyclase (GGDEF)-like protein
MNHLKAMQADSPNNFRLVRRPDSVLDFSEEMTTLWSETSIEGLIRQFSKTLKTRFRIRNFSVYSVVTRGNITKVAPIEILEDAVKPFSEGIVSALETHLTLNNDRDFGILKQGVFLGGEVNIFRLGDEKQQFAAVATQVSSSDFDILNLLIMQLQNEVRWHQKMAATAEKFNRDGLTNLYSCGYFEQAIDRELLRADRYQSQFSVLFLDVDDFKAINDTYGHLIGSDLLKQLARVLCDVLREVDVVARFGGDEFVALLIGVNGHFSRIVAERLRERISRTEFDVGNGTKAFITTSMGLANYPNHGKSKEELLQSADRSMYGSKQSGKNRVMSEPQGQP